MPGFSTWGALDWRNQRFPKGMQFSINTQDSESVRPDLVKEIHAVGFRILLDASDMAPGISRSESNSGVGLILADRPASTNASERVGSWFLSPGGIVLELLFILLVAFLALGVVGLWPLPLGLLGAPVVLVGAGLWHGFFTRPQSSDLLRITYAATHPSKLGGGEVGERLGKPISWRVTIDYGRMRFHNRLRPGFQTDRFLDRIDPPAPGDATLQQFSQERPEFRTEAT